MDGVLQDVRSSGLSESEKALFAFLQKVNHHAHEIRQADVDAVKRAGWSDEALYDAFTVCSLFNFFNRWCDAAGVHGMSEKEFEESGKRLAKFGYAPG